MNKHTILATCSMVAVLLLLAGRLITVGYIETNDRNVESFSSIAEYVGIVAGILMMIVGLQFFKSSILHGIIPFGVGFSVFAVCAYILYLKSI